MSVINECFNTNTTFTNVSWINNDKNIQWFASLNFVCNEFHASNLQRRSVPRLTDNGEIMVPNIRRFLGELVKSSESWKKMKLIVLGHGRIGKTTLLVTIHNILHPSEDNQVSSADLKHK